MNFYIKNNEVNKIFDENEFLNFPESEEIKKFILDRKHAMGYINEKYDDFVLLIFPTRHDIIHFEIHHRLKPAVMGILVKTEEAYETISENIDDKDTHLEFLKTPNPPAVTVEIQEVFKDYYEEHKEEVENLLMKIGAVLFEIKI